MKTIVYIVAAMALVVLVITVIGYLLPKEHVAKRRAMFRKPPLVVYALISGPQDWRPGSKDDPPTVMVESVPPKRHVTRISDPSLPFGGTWTWELEPTADGGCEVRLTEDGFVSNPIFRFISHFFIGHHSSMDTYLKHLAAKLGE